MMDAVLDFCSSAERADRARNEATIHPEGVFCIRDLSYGPHGVWNLLDIHYPEGTDHPLPVIVSVHGGGYVYGTKEVYHHYCADLTRRGFVVVNFNYRLAPESRFPAQLEDIHALFHWLAAHGNAYPMNLERLFLIGDSAGAQLASQYAAIAVNREYGKLFFDDAPPIPIRALGLNCGMYDLRAKLRSPVFRLGKAYMGEDFDLTDSRLDVLGAVNGGYPPAHITTSFHDFNRPGAEPFGRLLRSLGIEAVNECYGAPEQTHIGHVFHVDIRQEEARRCNDSQCAFFNRFL